MPLTVDYRTYALELRVCGWLFRKIWLVTYTFDKALRYGVVVEDPTFGKFEISGNMLVEWKSEGRWYQTKPQLVVDHLLTQRGVRHGTEAARRDRNNDG